MQLVAKSKLLVTREQADALLATMLRVNAARTWLATEAMTLPTWDRPSKKILQQRFYYPMRSQFGLPSQLTIRAIATVAACFERDPWTMPTFRDKAAIAYDDRILTFKVAKCATPTAVSIATLDDRAKWIPIVAGGPHAECLAGDRGASTLVLRKGRWYLHTAVTVPDGKVTPPTDYLGVDLGIINLAVDSDGNFYSGATVEAVRKRMCALRDALQACGSRSAKRHLKRLSGKEARFRANVNHVISKAIVKLAKGTGRAIALEDLQGIVQRVQKTVNKSHRVRIGSWSFYQLRVFIQYKAKRAGVVVVLVAAKNTSRTCPMPDCGHCDKRNRRSQAEFVCRKCGFADHADHVGSVNIAKKGAVSRPIVSDVDAGNVAPLATRVPAESRRKPRPLGRGA